MQSGHFVSLLPPLMSVAHQQHEWQIKNCNWLTEEFCDFNILLDADMAIWV
jgi:hypothetical protein